MFFPGLAVALDRGAPQPHRDAEPSDAALVWGRIGGVLFILVGLRLLFPF